MYDKGSYAHTQLQIVGGDFTYLPLKCQEKL